MKSSRKGLVCAGMLAAIAGLTGCGGISGSQGVSPANFLMPGVMNRPVTPSSEMSLATLPCDGKELAASVADTVSVFTADKEKPMARIQTSSSNDL